MDTGGGRDSGQQCSAAGSFIIHIVDDDDSFEDVAAKDTTSP